RIDGLGGLFGHGHRHSFAGAALGDPERIARGLDCGWRVKSFLDHRDACLVSVDRDDEILPLPFSATKSLPFAARMPSGPLTGWSIQISTGCSGLPAASTGMRYRLSENTLFT